MEKKFIQHLAPVHFHGSIIEALSTNLPNDSRALNELIKNAYDASASSITISLDTSTSTMVLTDDGTGMDAEDMKRLFHIARSSKQYGAEFTAQYTGEKRYIQGSKGLGFLAALRIGYEVTWKSSKGEGKLYELTCRGEELERKEVVDSTQLEIREFLDDVPRGTTIIMRLNREHLIELQENFGDETWVSQIANSFYASSLTISLRINHYQLPAADVHAFKTVQTDRQLFYVAIDGKDKEVVVYHKNAEVRRFAFPAKMQDYMVAGELMIYDLTHAKKKEKSPLFVNERNERSPLIYINDNFFPDFTLFDPGVNRSKRSAESLPQIIGYISIFSSSRELMFNADRTKLANTKLTRNLKKFLHNLNLLIQAEAVKLKQSGYTVDSDKTTPGGENGGGISQPGGKQKPESPNEGSPNPSSKKIEVTAAEIVVPPYVSQKVNDGQLDLKKLIEKATNSEGVDIRNEVNIAIDGEPFLLHVLSSQPFPCVKNVEYSYYDKNTGIIKKNTRIEYSSRREKKPDVQHQLLRFGLCPSTNVYLTSCSTMSQEMNRLYRLDKDSYPSVLSASVRCIYELSLAALLDTQNIPSDLRKAIENAKKAEEKVASVWDFLQTNQNNFTSSVTKDFIITYKTIMNTPTSSITDMYAMSNLGAHKGDLFVTMKDVVQIAQKASMFAAVVSKIVTHCDETLSNP